MSNKMLLFSDLHLSPSTFECCMEVLRRVHHEASTRGCSVGFLGDFFDHVYNKGTLPVDILNELMRFFSNEWHVPMIMIPGNHDYFDASETEHGLTPFKYASKYITVFDKPTVYRNSLWVPWRRDITKLKDVLAAHSVSCIFGHFDIIGFKLNASKISTEGLEANIFPKTVPVYTGHYHTPQTFDNIMYLGSPYQLTLSEAEDKKALVVLDLEYKVAEKIPIDIGKHQYKWSIEEFERRHLELRHGDRVSVTGTPPPETSLLIQTLKDKQIFIDVRAPKKTVNLRISNKLSAPDLLKQYAVMNNIDPCDIAPLVEWVQKNQDKWPAALQSNVEPIRMEISGFGPFIGPVTLSLCRQGFTLISGSCGPNASNGSGKSMITAGAWLWACTGQIDCRGSLSFSDPGVVRSDCDCARVSVHGLTNGKPWNITRQMGKKHIVEFSIDGRQRTRSTIHATQMAISREIFGLDLKPTKLHAWLLKNSVWSQSSVTRWLDASDTQAKQEISLLANITIWNELYEQLKLKAKRGREERQTLENIQNANNILLETAKSNHKTQIEKAEQWKMTNDEHRKRQATELEIAKERLSTFGTIETIDDVDDGPLKEAEEALDKFRTCLAQSIARKEHAVASCPKKPENVPTECPDIQKTALLLRQTQSESDARKAQWMAKQDAIKDFTNNSKCHACNRPFENKTHYEEQLRSLRHSVSLTRDVYRRALEAFQKAKAEHMESTRLEMLYQQGLQYEQTKIKIDEYEKNIRTFSSRFQELASKTCEMKQNMEIFRRKKAKNHQLRQQKKLAEQHVQILEGNFNDIRTQNPYDCSDSEVIRLTEKVRAVQQKLILAVDHVQKMELAMKWAGPKGIQTYAMEHTLHILADKTNTWLRRFFNTDDICLLVGFDEKERLIRSVKTTANKGVMSGGQWRRVQLASFMAWKDMTEFPLLIMDEPCTSMDSVGIRATQHTLRNWCEDDARRTCFFITHEPEQHRDTSVYNNHIRILKKRGRSSVVDQYRARKYQKK